MDGGKDNRKEDTMTQLSAAEIMAVAKGISSKESKSARAELEAGEHRVSGTFTVDGTLLIAEDQEIKATASLLNKEFLALVLHHAGITRDHAKKVIGEVAEDYLIDWSGSKEDKKAAKKARKAAVAEYDPEGKIAGAFDEFAEDLPKVPRAGKVTFKGAVAKADTESASDEAAA